VDPIASTRETLEQKARRYLGEARITIRLAGPERIRALVRGMGEFFTVAFDRGGWTCSCPAKRRCAHLEAQLVTVRPGAWPRLDDLKG